MSPPCSSLNPFAHLHLPSVLPSPPVRLDEIKSLNCSCYGLQDISILAELKNVEVLSLSLNKISSLRDFSRCFKLKELYLRKNEVPSLSDIDYLRGLPELTTLWLSENPVAESQGYRMSVVRGNRRTPSHLCVQVSLGITTGQLCLSFP